MPEPVAALYEQNKAHHVGFFPDLEDQLCGWVAGDKSPDRLDALVWAGTELMLSTSYGEIPSAAVGSIQGTRPDDADALVQGILRKIKAQAEQEQGGATAQQGGEPELSQAQLEHAAGLARMLGRLEGLGGSRW